ncbi:hypothetical protein [Streptomyces sp. NPDC020983]|uniref:hypothetical protein n=1 Tax=Streptomyces sp. NPDC020983 TaxID=3365106 RepID=UPI00379FD136
MRPLQELPELAAPPLAAAPSGAGSLSPSPPGGSCGRFPPGRRLRCVIGLIGGVLWWGALLQLGAGPAADPWVSAVAAGGWGLGLIPLHAVPAHVRRAGAGRSRAVRARAARSRHGEQN